MRNAAAAPRTELDVASIHSPVINLGMEHFHQHVYIRHIGTPPDFAWDQVDEWLDAPHGDITAVADLCRRLAAHFTSAMLASGKTTNATEGALLVDRWQPRAQQSTSTSIG